MPCTTSVVSSMSAMFVSPCGRDAGGRSRLHGLLRSATALDTAVLRARSAGSGDLLAERLTRAEDTHRGVVLRDALLFGEGRHRDAVDLDALQCVGILGLQSVGEASHATADLVADHFRRLFRRLDLLGEERE